MLNRTLKLRSLLQPISKNSVTYEVSALEKQYLYQTKVYIPKKPYKKILPGYSLIKTVKKKKRRAYAQTEDDTQRSLRRTKQKIQDFILSNEFTLFATFTFSKDRQNINARKRSMNDWLKNQKKKYGNFEYLIIPEFHKDGISIHFHALLKDYGGELIPWISKKTGRQVVINGREAYNFNSYKQGWNTAVRIDQTQESHAKLGKYVSKYLTKDMPLFAGQNRYWRSQSLKLPRVVENPPAWYLNETPDDQHPFEHGLILTFINRKQTW